MKRAKLVLVAASLSLAACKDDPGPPVSARCQADMDQGRTLLKVQDYGAARDWLAQARKECGPGAKGDVDAFEREIDETEQRQKAAAAQRAAPATKPASESLVAQVVAQAAAYRKEKTRTAKCDDAVEEHPPICEGTRGGGEVVQVNVATVVKDMTALSVFASLPKELVDCAAFGAHDVKRAWKKGGAPRYQCALKDGPLASMMVFLDQHPERPETDVTFFTASWLGYDPNLTERLAESGDP